ncbi:Neurexin-3-alpha [Operophtera brumata]|uniref:Neurexin-3-alpha n=1 Tax=Operophtera brumata TaxID=104452 RepID=A0A0L7LI99_OPEBR|nr:Neurexin-3-alpha [Operophtera brumata]
MQIAKYFLLTSINLRDQTSRISNASGDACERRDPCQHGGVCISTDDGPLCECRDGDYEGAFCERGFIANMASASAMRSLRQH